MFVEENDPMTETPTASSSKVPPSHTKTSKAASQEETKPRSSSFDINGPPPVEKETVMSKTFSLFDSSSSKNHVLRKNSKTNGGERSLFQPTAETKTTKSANANTDDEVPHAAAGVIPTAAEALLCPDSVVDYVINATDLKDECDGLRNAFSKYCADTEGSDSKQSKPARRLQESDEHNNNSQRKTNPVLIWERRLRYLIESLQEWWGPNIRVEIDSISQYNDDLWIKDTDSIHKSRRLNDAAEQFLKEETSAELGETLKNENEDEHANEDENANEDGDIDQLLEGDESKTPGTEKPVKTAPKGPRMSLDLPIKGHHLSDKALSESLLLHQDDRSVMASVKAMQNATNPNSNTTEKAAAVNAAASLKAVSTTTELVSSLLNDPSSVEARTCCTSVLSVFHEICSVDEEESLSDRQLFISVAVIVVCGLVKSLIRHFQIRWLPEAAGCVLVGVGAGWAISYFPHHAFSFDDHWFLRVMVPPIIFEAALSIDKRAFNRHVVPILLFSSFGTLFATLMTASIVHNLSQMLDCRTIPFIESMTFGALISSIDPIAVLSVLNNMGMTDTDTIYVLIFGESLLNDGIAIVLFDTLLHFLDENMKGDVYAVAAAGIHFMVVAIGSLLVGLGSGICCALYYWIMHGCQQPLVEILTFCCWALLPYYICDGIDWSGIVAVVAAGFVMDMFVVGQHHQLEEKIAVDSNFESNGPRRRKVRPVFGREGHLSPEAKLHIHFVTEIMATMMETAIFAYLGLFLFSARYHWNFSLSFIAIFACLVGRAVMIPSLSIVANWFTRREHKNSGCCSPQLPVSEPGETKQPNAAGVIVDKKMQLVLWFAGLRGAMSFALVESIPLYDPVSGEGTKLKSELKAMTSACIIFTVFVLGGLTYYMMEFLGLAPSTGTSSTDGNSGQEMVSLMTSTGNEEDYEEPEEKSMMMDKKETPPRGNRFRQRIRE
ncbi:unnamed protein product [Cylindrotheca closterium]|uniref:Cation/H+ exchanger transmembrane domain-containing protein n=1 Tax=Cylindrotheca closterium TaxID=2856 RepID=A0AAD2CDH2_9STRA|nr:unnamed protein product [Cylindrotheca closterium]